MMWDMLTITHKQMWVTLTIKQIVLKWFKVHNLLQMVLLLILMVVVSQYLVKLVELLVMLLLR